MARLVRAAGQQKVSASAIMLALIAGLLFWNTAMDPASAEHQPADKVVAAGSGIDQFDETIVLLEETMRVSSTSDLMLHLTSECSIITELITGGPGMASETSEAMGQVEVWITIDDKPVPVSTTEDANPATPEFESDDGKVVLCNRTYGRTVTDGEDDGTDTESDYIRTRQANAFNWLALDVGKDYDDPAIGDSNNIVEVVVHADYTTSETGRAVADAFVGKRVLIVEPTHASVHEQVQPVDPAGT